MASKFSKIVHIKRFRRNGTVVSTLHSKMFLPLKDTNRGFSLSSILLDKNHYEILGIKPSASPAEIKAAYFKMSKKYHPDMNKEPDAIVVFSAITTAYQVLSDPKSRRFYNAKTFRRMGHGGDEGYVEKGSDTATAVSYGSHMRHPEYLFNKTYYTQNDKNYYSYERTVKRNYEQYIYDRTASHRTILEHRKRLNDQNYWLSQNTVALWILVPFILLSTYAVVTFTGWFADQAIDNKQKRQYHLYKEYKSKKLVNTKPRD